MVGSVREEQIAYSRGKWLSVRETPSLTCLGKISGQIPSTQPLTPGCEMSSSKVFGARPWM